MLSLIAQGKYNSTIGYDKCQAFIQWLRRQDLTNNSEHTNSEQRVDTPKQNVLPLPSPGSTRSFKPRISFSQNEIESLTEWFNEDKGPTREVMRQYTDILNIPRQMASIRLLTPESIYFWFKNKRSKQRKLESSLLEPWEGENETPESADKVKDAPQATVTTAVTPHVGKTSELLGSGSPQVTTATNANSGTSVSVVTTGEGSDEVHIPVNGLATMLAQYTPPQLNYGGSSTKVRKIPKSRVTFDPQTELSSLNKWFDDNERPGKEIVAEYTNILNEARSQKSKRMLTPDSIAMWFKNRRAKKRRCEGDVLYPGENDWQQTTEDLKQEGQTSVTGKDTDTTMDVSTTEDLTTVATVPMAEATLSSVTGPTNGGTVTSQAVTEGEDHERNIFSAGLVAVKTTTI